MEVRILGPIEVRDAAGPVDVGGPRQLRVVVAMAMAPGRTLSLERLAERSFDDADRPDDAVPAVRTAVRRLRRALGDDAIETVSNGYRLTESVVVDADRFEELLAQAKSATDPVSSASLMRRAIDLWSGDAFGQLRDLDWLLIERERLEELRLRAIEGWHEAHIRNGTVTEVIASLESAAAHNPHRERAHRQLMLGLYLADRQAEALRAYQSLVGELADVGLDPSEETTALERRIAAGDPTLVPVTNGRPLRGYNINERVGEGAFSIVYQGVQPSVGRRVAIKQIRAELANRPEFIRRFEAEAHMVARLEHPHIVPLYDYWREPGSAYLVMRLLLGGSLETSLIAGRWDLDRTSQMVSQIGSALSTAHRAGVIHRDVKPANILLDDLGNCYLTDFGIAVDAAEALDPAATLSAGSPAYAAPEQLRREVVGPQADVFGLGIAAFEALTGHLPFPDEPDQASLLRRQLADPIPLVRTTRNDVPSTVDDVLQRATARDPGARYQSVDDFTEAFETALGDSPASGSVVHPRNLTLISGDERNPYKGLLAFDEADAVDFSGRDRLVDQLLERIGEDRFVCVVGPSGSGKSSVVRAGLLPAIRRGSIAGSESWFVATMMPSAHPLEELEGALVRISSEQPADLFDVLNSGERGLTRALHRVLPPDAQLLLVIDQFEELFTLASKTEARAFIDALVGCVTGERPRVRVVATLRADFYDRPLRHEALGRLVRDATVPVLPLAADELERAIVEPATAVGCEFEPGLVSEIVADVTDQPAALPMLQYALTELWNRRVSGLLTRQSYREIGGITGALAARADDIYEAESEAGQDEVRRLFGRLVALGEGTEDTRRRILRTEVGSSDDLSRIIDSYGTARLLSFDRDDRTREPTVEVAHEALIREWPRLRRWVDDDRDGLRIHRHLTDTATGWIESGRDIGELYSGGRLEAAQSWAAEHGGDMNEGEADFLGASEERRVEVEELERRRLRRLRTALVGVGVVAVVAVIAGLVAFGQQRKADDAAAAALVSRNVAETGRLAADAAALAGEDVPLSLLLGVEAHLRDPGPVGLGALQTSLAGAGSFLGLTAFEHAQEVRWVDNERLVVGGSDGVWLREADGSMVQISTTAVHQELRPYGDGNVSYDPMFDAAGPMVAFVVAGATNVVELISIDGGSGREIVSEDRVDALELSADGSLLATLDAAGDLSLYDVATGDLRWEVHAHPESVAGELDLPEDAVEGLYGSPAREFLAEMDLDDRRTLVRFDAAGQSVVTVESMAVRKWDVSTGIRTSNFVLHDDTAIGRVVAFGTDGFALDPSGERYVSNQSVSLGLGKMDGTGAGAFRLVETATAFSGTPKADRLWWDGSDRAFVLFTDGRAADVDLETGDLVSEIVTGLTSVVDFDVSPDGSKVAFAANEGIGVWSRVGDGLIASGIPRRGSNNAALLGDDIVAANYAQILGTGWEPAVWWDDAGNSPVQIRTPADDQGVDWGMGLPWGDSTFGSMTAGFKASIWDLDSRSRISTMQMVGSWTGQAFSNDFSIGAFGTTQMGGLAIFNVGDGSVVTVLAEPGDSAFAMSFNVRDDRLAAVGIAGQVYVYDTATWELVDSGSLDDVNVRVLRFSPDGRFLATILDTGDLALWDADTFVHIKTILGPGRPTVNDSDTMLFDSSGRYFVSAADRAVRLWDLDEGTQVGSGFPTDPDFRVGGKDGFVLMTASGEFILRWNLDFDAWPDIACKAAGRNMTLDEWNQFAPSGEPYRRTCDMWPDPATPAPAQNP